MANDGSPQVTRRSSRLSSSEPISKYLAKNTKTSNLPPLTIDDFAFGDENTITSAELISSFPGRRTQILELISLLGPLNSPTIPLFVYGGSSTGKTSVVVHTFRHLNRPFVYSSCLTCHNPRILFESILNQLLLHRKDAGNGYSSAKRCEKPADFVNLLREALLKIVENLKGRGGKSSSGRVANGKMIYLIIDHLELVREWDKSDTILPFLFKLYDILKVPELCLIFISKTSPDTYYSDTGCVEPIPVYFPDYTEKDIQEIFMRNQPNPKLYSSFLDVVMRPFCRITRRVDELNSAFSTLFAKYCEPLSDVGITPTEAMKRRMYEDLKPHIAPCLNEVFRVSSHLTSEGEAKKEKIKRKGNAQTWGSSPTHEELEFHMSTSAKYLLISAFLASRNPATLDASMFDSTGGSDNRKRKRKSSEKAIEKKETAEQESLLKGPGTFPLERLLAIFQCITSVIEDLPEEDGANGLGSENWDNRLMPDVLLQLSSLCNANFISKGASCPLDGSTRYRSTVSEEMALKHLLKFKSDRRASEKRNYLNTSSSHPNQTL